LALPSGVPLIPAMNVAVCLLSLPIRIVPDSPALPALAIVTLSEPVGHAYENRLCSTRGA
jgi:hypothetical protein